MTLKNQTKLLFAQELEQMLKVMPMEKIRIVDLCKRCGTITQTFYYHFHDKYELVAWIFLYDFSLIYGDKKPEYSIASITKNLTQMEQRKTFYQKTYTDNSQNSINKYIQKFNVISAKNAVEKYYQTSLTAEQEYAIKYHSYGSMGLFNEWLNNQTPITIEQLATFQYKHTPKFLKVAYQNYPFRNSKIFR
ncbi:MAG TPA: TetR family transcriptional regulator [Lactobacillus sp.]|nr:TetR family transcriptional regulator [Lactobacillus sp.]